MPVSRKKKRTDSKTTEFHYLVMLNCVVDDVPLKITTTRMEAEAFALRTSTNGIPKELCHFLPSEPSHISIVEFRNGVPSRPLSPVPLMLGNQFKNRTKK